MRKVTDLGKNEVIHCSTKEKAVAICDLLNKFVLKIKSPHMIDRWNTYREETCFFNDGEYADLSYCKEQEIKIYSDSDFIFKPKRGDSTRECRNF